GGWRMSAFRFSHAPIDTVPLRAELLDTSCGGFAAFEGWVRDHNEGQQVRQLDYEAFEALGVREGERIIEEARQRFGITQILCVHRLGGLGLTDFAVGVGAASPHLDVAFGPRSYVIDEETHRVQYKHEEHYVSADTGCVNCDS